ncbi:polyhydroxybutyrate depolymerase [Pelomyxa schiedti]|nr:polyhydroxybutyrate depolymerase [Pelomyxa schiedti]
MVGTYRHCGLPRLSGVLIAVCFAVSYGQKLSGYNIDDGTPIGVAGLSSGAFMATQLHVAHSDIFGLVANVAGGPYWCANADVLIAESSCMTTPNLIVTDELIAATEFARLTLSIDSPQNMNDDKVYLFSGLKDSVVDTGVVEKAADYYTFYVNKNVSGTIHFENSVLSEHAWVTDNWGNDCGYLGSPYINNCNYDLAGEILEYFYGKLNSKVTQISANLLSFKQENYTPLKEIPILLSLDDTGFVYVPTQCSKGETCKLLVVLHGCEQGYSYIGNMFTNYAGFNEWAESNNIIILYPQATSATVPVNPNGCWDWWGYTGLDYATDLGLQIATIKNMVDALQGK